MDMKALNCNGRMAEAEKMMSATEKVYRFLVTGPMLASVELTRLLVDSN